jgi:hypothetical protein
VLRNRGVLREKTTREEDCAGRCTAQEQSVWVGWAGARAGAE